MSLENEGLEEVSRIETLVGKHCDMVVQSVLMNHFEDIFDDEESASHNDESIAHTSS